MNTCQSIQSIAVAHRQATLDAQTSIGMAHLADAQIRVLRHPAKTAHRETSERQKWRELFSLARRLPDTVLAVTFVKPGGEPRTILCRPSPSEDLTLRYALVWDLDEQDHRRVNLDGIVKVTMETHAVGLS